MSHFSNARLAPLEMKLREFPVPWGGVGSVDNADPPLCPAEGGSSPPSLHIYFTPAQLCAPRAVLSHSVHRQQLGHRELLTLFVPRKVFPPRLESSSCSHQRLHLEGAVPAASGDAPEPAFVFQSLTQNIPRLWALRLGSRGGFAPAGGVFWSLCSLFQIH